MKNPITTTKNFVVKNKTEILICALAATTTVIVLLKIGVNQHNAFLTEKGLFDEYYTPAE